MNDDPDLHRRAAVHAALGEPCRLAIVDDLGSSDRSPTDLGDRHGLPTNLLAHHLHVLEEAGLIVRLTSSGDRRRRYVRLVREQLLGLEHATCPPAGPMLFLCSHNSARSQLAAAIWRSRTGTAAESAGTHPALRVHHGAIAAGRRAGIDLEGARPRLVDRIDPTAQVVTVCDRAHEELQPDSSWWHWSTPDPVEVGTDEAFDAVVADLETRVSVLLERPTGETQTLESPA